MTDHDRTEVDPMAVDRAPTTGELTAGTRFGGYVIDGVAGRGGMGVVRSVRIG